jgi:hypothetical protein
LPFPSIGKTRLSITHDDLNRGGRRTLVERCDNHSVIPAVCYGDSISVDRDLAWILERPWRDCRLISREMQRLAVEGATHFRVLDQAVDEREQHLGRKFPGVCAYYIPGWVDRDERRPGRDRIRPPRPKLPVIQDRVNCIESYRRVANSARDTLSVELAARNSDYDKLSRVLRFELPQLREYMDAVDSPICPEIQKHDFASQIGKPKLLSACVNPVEIVGKLGCPHLRCRGELSRHRLKSSIFGGQDCTNYATA